MAVEKQVVTVADYENFLRLPENRDRLFELIDGEIVEKMVTREHGILAGEFVTELNLYLRKTPSDARRWKRATALSVTT